MARLTTMPSRLGRMPSRLAPAVKRAERFYQSAEWRSLVRDVKAMRGSYCERCGAGPKVIADHIVERRDGGADLDMTNIELLCPGCHARKTAAAKARRAAGEALPSRG